MSDDWKWVLRASQSTRPVLRLLAGFQFVAAAHHGLDVLGYLRAW